MLRKKLTERGSVPKDDAEHQKRVIKEFTQPKIIDYMKAKFLDVLDVMYVGSAYEGVNIAGSIEYDIMFIMDGRELDIVNVQNGYWTLSRSSGDREILSSTKSIQDVLGVLQKLKNILSKDSDLTETLNVRVNKITQGRGYVYVELSQDGTSVAHKIFPCYKTKSSELFAPSVSSDRKDEWIQVFPLKEKEELKKGGCRKDCLRLLKILHKDENVLQQLSSYHMKALLLLESSNEDINWGNEYLEERWLGLLKRVIGMLETKELPHFVLKGVNIFPDIKDKTLENMINRLKVILKKETSSLSDPGDISCSAASDVCPDKIDVPITTKSLQGVVRPSSYLRKRLIDKGFVVKEVADVQKRLIKEFTQPKIIDYMKAKFLDVLDVMYVGSAYEGVNIAGSIEYDIMFIMDGRELDVVNVQNGYWRLSRSSGDREVLSSTKSIQDVLGVLQKLKNILSKDSDETLNVRVNKITQGRGYVYVELSQDGTSVAHKIFPCYKTKSSELFAPSVSSDRKDEWIQVFPLKEKEELKKGGCRKDCLRLLKILHKDENVLQQLSSYHMKALLLLESSNEDINWGNEYLEERWLGLLKRVIGMLETKELPHFVLKGVNIFPDIKDKTLENMINRLKVILKKEASSLSDPGDISCRSQSTFERASSDRPNPLEELLRRFYAAKIPAPRQMAEGQRKLMEEIKDEIAAELRKERFVREIRYTGSAYEGVNLKTSSDYDLMVVIDGHAKVRIVKEVPAFVMLKTDDLVFKELFGTHDGLLRPSVVISHFMGLLQKKINRIMQLPQHIGTDLEIIPHEHGPAIELDVKRGNDLLSLDITPAFLIDDNHRYIAKTPKPQHVQGDHDDRLDPKMFWRQSFSFEEVKLLKKADDDGGCRKMVLRIMKAIRKTKEGEIFQKLSSYHFKSLLLHLLKRKNVDWSQAKLADRFRDFLEALSEKLEENFLEHYFIPGFNLFQGIKKDTFVNMRNRVERILNSENRQQKLLGVDVKSMY